MRKPKPFTRLFQTRKAAERYLGIQKRHGAKHLDLVYSINFYGWRVTGFMPRDKVKK